MNYIQFHEKTTFLILAGSAFYQNIIRAECKNIVYCKMHLLLISENSFVFYFLKIKSEGMTLFIDFTCLVVPHIVCRQT